MASGDRIPAGLFFRRQDRRVSRRGSPWWRHSGSCRMGGGSTSWIWKPTPWSMAPTGSFPLPRVSGLRYPGRPRGSEVWAVRASTRHTDGQPHPAQRRRVLLRRHRPRAPIVDPSATDRDVLAGNAVPPIWTPVEQPTRSVAGCSHRFVFPVGHPQRRHPRGPGLGQPPLAGDGSRRRPRPIMTGGVERPRRSRAARRQAVTVEHGWPAEHRWPLD
jgi:hypothetical protein